MSVNLEKLKAMRTDHEGRVGDLSKVVVRIGADIVFGKGTFTADEVRDMINLMIPYYRHVGAKWVLDSVLDGKEFDWNRTVPPDATT